MVLNLLPVREEKWYSTHSANSQLGNSFVETLAEKLLTTTTMHLVKNNSNNKAYHH